MIYSFKKIALCHANFGILDQALPFKLDQTQNFLIKRLSKFLCDSTKLFFHTTKRDLLVRNLQFETKLCKKSSNQI